MPDLLSHVLIGLIIAEIIYARKKSLVVLGALLPDIITKIDLLAFHLGMNYIVSFGFFHTPLMILLLMLLIAPLFRYGRLKTLLLIGLGATSHFLSDMTMRHFTGYGGVYLFFPLSMSPYTLNLIWPEESFYFLFGSIFAYIFVKVAKKAVKKNAPAGNFM